MKDQGLIYLASPYSAKSAKLREWRFRAVAWYASNLMRSGWLIFSPIAHTHPIADFGLPTDWDFWQRYDQKILDACTGMIVLKLSGWTESLGVGEEIKIMLRAGKPIEYHDWPEAGYQFVGDDLWSLANDT